MAVDNSLESLLNTLTTSIQAATEALPKDEIIPPKDGISLLDVKNELLLSYLQNLVFLILLKLRSRPRNEKEENGDSFGLQDDVVKKLVELRVYLEKGVRPLENRLKYEIDRILRSTDDAARKSAQAVKSSAKKSQDAMESDSDAESAASKESDEESDAVTYAPRGAAFSRPKARDDKRASASSKDGIYRPPKITPVSMPTTERREERQARRPGKSATLDEFVATELSGAPIARPSIGSTIVEGGRRLKSEKERREEAEKREYEESNFTRLPKQSKKERAKQRNRGGGFGGEEWRGLGAGLERIERLTQKKGGALGSLEKSRKRPVDDGPRGTGSTVGDAFEKRRKVVSRYKR